MKKILVTVDFSNTAKEVVNQAASLAHETESEVFLLYVAPANPDYIGFKTFNHTEREEIAKILHIEHAQLQEMAHELIARGIKSKALILQGDVVESILHEADKKGVDLIVMGSHGYGGLTRALLGSISEGVLRKTTRPILIVPHRD